MRFFTIWTTLRLWDNLESEKLRLWELYNLKNFETFWKFTSWDAWRHSASLKFSKKNQTQCDTDAAVNMLNVMFFFPCQKKHFKKPLEMKGYWNGPYQPAGLKQPWRFTLFQRPALLWPHQHSPPWNANFNTHKAQNCEWYHKIIFIVRSNLINPNVLFWKPFYMQTL